MGMGRDPVTSEPLGPAYTVCKSVAQRVEVHVKALDQRLDPMERGCAISVIEAKETERGTRRAVAGFDFTFSIPKSATVLWCVGDAGAQALIEGAHHAAVAGVVAFMEREVAATCSGAASREGTVAQVDVRGLIATGYDHYNFRAGYPHLHTHVVISNKAQTVFDDKWRALDSRATHAATVALSELHESLFADRLTTVLGVEWESRQRGRYRNPAWAIAPFPEALVAEFSSRSRYIDEEKHGRQPSTSTIIKLRAQATLTTQPEKMVHSFAGLTTDWRDRASNLLGEDATDWARRVAANEAPLLLHADDIPLDVIRHVGESVVAAVGEKRWTWRRWNLTAEATRQTILLSLR